MEHQEEARLNAMLKNLPGGADLVERKAKARAEGRHRPPDSTEHTSVRPVLAYLLPENLTLLYLHL